MSIKIQIKAKEFPVFEVTGSDMIEIFKSSSVIGDICYQIENRPYEDKGCYLKHKISKDGRYDFYSMINGDKEISFGQRKADKMLFIKKNDKTGQYWNDFFEKNENNNTNNQRNNYTNNDFDDNDDIAF